MGLRLSDAPAVDRRNPADLADGTVVATPQPPQNVWQVAERAMAQFPL